MITNPKEWRSYKKEDIMRHVYWEHHQLPPIDKKEYEKAWQKIKKQLIEKYTEKK